MYLMQKPTVLKRLSAKRNKRMRFTMSNSAWDCFNIWLTPISIHIASSSSSRLFLSILPFFGRSFFVLLLARLVSKRFTNWRISFKLLMIFVFFKTNNAIRSTFVGMTKKMDAFDIDTSSCAKIVCSQNCVKFHRSVEKKSWEISVEERKKGAKKVGLFWRHMCGREQKIHAFIITYTVRNVNI